MTACSSTWITLLTCGDSKEGFTNQSKAFLLFFHVFRSLGYDEEQIAFLLKKNEFSYEWLDSFEKLNMSWDMMKKYPNFAWLRTPHVHQYLQLYLICNVVQLADILAAFVNKICQHTTSSPGGCGEAPH